MRGSGAVGQMPLCRRCLEKAMNNNEYYEPDPMEQIKTEVTTRFLQAKNEG